ncbi:hypothetical protein CAPTEDRAFT_148520 [Capitella teleta]|uniref:Regulator of microtubule dynamics protein 1 n=1 Tax=Capitella teleta TaxID=283909 RepID=R7TY52_CAPTE|nr:hypothetical protein CAPTEDRAFT_148520 [Capitella teleta]|eukprot:ELT98679.1 hypothetical protein CAPTEDRAFT_148520 [Capitella teleta]
MDATIKQADALYEEYKIDALYDLLLPFKDSNNDELLWRLARAAREKAQTISDKKVANALVYDALGYVDAALALNDNNFASHKWRAILLDLVGEIEGNKQRIQNAFPCKEHFKKAIALNPKDATTIHCLGLWCFSVADMGWVKRKLAATVYAAPPESSYEEALQYFLDAEKVKPGFYSMNLLMIGKTYYRIGKKDLAIEYLKQAREFTVITSDDEKANKEAIEILKSLGVK